MVCSRISIAAGAALLMVALVGCGNGEPGAGPETVTVTESQDDWGHIGGGTDDGSYDDGGYVDEGYSADEEYYDEPEQEIVEPALPPEVAKHGFSYMDGGRSTTWGAVLRNDGPDLSSVEILATGFNAHGTAIDTEELHYFRLPSGESMVGGYFLEKGITDVKVEISSHGDPYAQDEVPISGELSGELSFTGTGYDTIVTAEVTSTLDVSTDTGVPFFVVFFDSSGNVVGGADDFAPGSYPAGSTKQVALDILSIPDEFASAKISFDIIVDDLMAH